jgi:hypothetical protein
MLFRAYNQIIDSDFDLCLPKAENLVSDFLFRKKQINTSAKNNTKLNRKGVSAKTTIEKDKILLEWENIAKFEAVEGKLLHYENFSDNTDVFRLFAISEALGLTLFQKGIFLLHGSAVKIGNKAVIFIGKPGAGKSTTVAAYAKAGFTVLSDDMTAISIDASNNPVVLPAYPQIKIWEDAVDNLGFDKTTLEPAFEGHNKFIFKQDEFSFPKEPVILSEIIIIQKPFSKKTTQLTINEGLIELMRHFPLPHQLLKGDNLQNHFIDSLKIASKVSIKKIRRPKDFKALQHFINTNQS